MATAWLKKEYNEEFERKYSGYRRVSRSLFGEKKDYLDVFLDVLIDHKEWFDLSEEPLECRPIELGENIEKYDIFEENFVKRYSMTYKLSLQELDTILQNTEIEIEGKRQINRGAQCAVKKNLQSNYIKFHIDILNEEKEEWCRYRTFKKSEVTRDKICFEIAYCCRTC